MHTSTPTNRLLLYVGFFATGVAFAIPGVLLPAIAHHWQWNDRASGWFLLLISAGSLLAPLTVARRATRAIVLGHALAAASALLWMAAWRFADSSSPMFAAAPVWGLGLGMVMTGTTVLSRHVAHEPAVFLLRINFLWSLGAIAAPLLALAGLGSGAPIRLLAPMATAFCLLCLSASQTEWQALDTTGPEPEALDSLRGVSVGLVLVTALATGVEASAGAWLTTYAGRLHLARTAGFSATACFWAGLLCSRAIGWRPHAKATSPGMLRVFLAVTLAASAGLIASTAAAWLLAASFLLGIGLGPLYPEFLSRVLAIRSTTLIFVAAGVASAIMPWATGQLSASSHSLRFGFTIPLFGAMTMLLCGWRSARLTPSPQSPPDA